MLKRIMCLLLCALLFNLACQGQKEEQLTVSQLANEANAWVKIYNAIGLTLVTHLQNGGDWSSQIGDSLDIEPQMIRSLVRMAANYTSHALNIQKVLNRYPHYQADSLSRDLKLLEGGDLLIETGVPETFRLSALGEQVMTQYWIYRASSAANLNFIDDADVKSLETALLGLMNSAKSLEDGFNNNSIHWRIDSRPDHFEQLPAIIKVSEYRKEYMAFINDNSHYKYDNFLSQNEDPQWKQLNMTAMAKELMSATRSGRTYDLNRCFHQRNWRVGKAGCEAAVKELETLGFVSREGDSLRQTASGTALSSVVQEFADNRLYSSWQQMDIGLYQVFIQILDELIAKGKQ